MTVRISLALCSLIGVLSAATAWAAEPPAGAAQIEAGEPRAQTSTPPTTVAPPATTTPTAAPAAVPAAAPAAARAGSAAPSAGSAATVGAAPAKLPAAKAPTAKPLANDRVDLDTTTVTGNRELPKVMYIVPWKKSDIGDLAGKPMNSLLDEVLAPVDRDVFRREVSYYGVLKGDTTPNAAPGEAPAKQVEK